MTDQILDARSFWELLDRRVAATPDRVLLIDDAGRSLTCAEFRDTVERVAAGFHGLGIGGGTAVTWELPTRIETVVASFALSRLGAVQNPIIHIYRHREVGFCIRQTGAEFVLHPGEWGGFDYGAMVAEVTAELDAPLINDMVPGVGNSEARVTTLGLLRALFLGLSLASKQNKTV